MVTRKLFTIPQLSTFQNKSKVRGSPWSIWRYVCWIYKIFLFFFIFKKNLVQVFISNLFCIRLNIVPKNTTQEIFAIINHPFEKSPLIFFFIAVYLVSFIFAINFTSILTLSFDLYILQINAFWTSLEK